MKNPIYYNIKYKNVTHTPINNQMKIIKINDDSLFFIVMITNTNQLSIQILRQQCHKRNNLKSKRPYQNQFARG